MADGSIYAELKNKTKENKRPEENCICQILTTSKHLRRTNVDFTHYNIISKLPANKNPLQFRIITQVMREDIYVRIGLSLPLAPSPTSNISIRQNNSNHIGIAIEPCVAATSCNLYLEHQPESDDHNRLGPWRG